MSSNTDFRVLGRLGTATGPLSGGTLRRTWSPRGGMRIQSRSSSRRAIALFGGGSGEPRNIRAILLGLSALVLAILFYLGSTAGSQMADPAATPTAVASVDPLLEASLLAGGTTLVDTGSRTLIPGGGEHATLRALPDAFAAMGDVALRLPAATVEGVLFGEADTPEALPLAPVGVMASNKNPRGYEPTLEAAEGPSYSVLPPATGVRPSTGQVSLLVAPGSQIVAPVEGEVVAVSQYETPDGSLDWQIRIAPRQRPDLHVVVQHVEQPIVIVGQRLEAGETVLGSVALLSPTATEDNPLALPSIVLSLRPALTPAEFDPYAPAVSPTATATS